MPYIRQRFRDELTEHSPENPGELNYAITMMLLNYLHDLPPSYHFYNEVIGVLESVKLEFYRRLMAPYEDEKMAENGDLPWRKS